MNYSKKHCKHILYVRNRDDAVFYNFARGKKNRKSLRKLYKDINSGVWQKRVFEKRGIKI